MQPQRALQVANNCTDEDWQRKQCVVKNNNTKALLCFITRHLHLLLLIICYYAAVALLDIF